MIWRNREEDELPDPVVRMYRETLDEDRLDFLRRGPRNGAERLAYAQRGHPDAYRMAQPAGAGAQAALLRDGILDNRRHFVGPDATVYQRGESTEEPLHASIRRGFESAVPGFRRAGLRGALAETMALGGGGGADRLAGDTGSDNLTSPANAGSGWQPAHEGGPLLMKEIALWSRHAAPADAAGLDPRDRWDVLRYLSYLDRRHVLSGEQQRLGRAAAGGLAWDESWLAPLEEQKQQFLDRLIADPDIEHGERYWAGLSDEQRADVLRRVVAHHSSVFGYPMPQVDYEPLPAPLEGQYFGDENRLVLDSARAAGKERERIPNAAHEGEHGHQKRLGDLWGAGMIQPTNPRHQLAEIAALTYPFFLPAGETPSEAYHGQILEQWADWLEAVIYTRLVDRFKARTAEELGLPPPKP